MENKSIKELEEIGTGDAYYELGKRYYESEKNAQNFSKAFEYFKKAEDAGSIKGSYGIAKCYYYGIGVQKDYKKAFEIFEMLMNNYNSENSKYFIGQIYYYGGHGVQRDYEKAFKIFKDLADNKADFDAIEYLATMYYCGKGTDINYELARKYCEIEEKDNRCHKYIFQYLGEIYFYGKGVEINYNKAKTYFEKALDEKYDDSYYKLGLLYSGDYGFKDEKKANKYFKKIEKDLLLSAIYLLLAIRPEEEQNLEGIYNYLGYSREDYLEIFINNIPFDHPAGQYYDRITYLENEEYKNIVKRLTEKIEMFLKAKAKLIFHFENEEDVDLYANNIINVI